MTTNEQRAEALRLLDIWERLGRTHMVAGGGCSCGAGGVVVALEDFEQDIADFLLAEAERQDRADVRIYLENYAQEGELWRIPRLLSSFTLSPVASIVHDPEAGVAGFVLARLGRTLHSFEKLHGSG